MVSGADTDQTALSGSAQFAEVCMSLITRKPVFGIFDQVRLKLACSADEIS